MYANDPRFERITGGVLYTTLGAGPESDFWNTLVRNVLRGSDKATAQTSAIDENGPYYDSERDRDVMLSVIRRGSPRRRSLSPPLDSSCNPIDEDTWIAMLFESDQSYKDNLDYDLVPSPAYRGYNSNSYIAGLLDAIRTSRPPLNGGTPFDNIGGNSSWPGYDKPVPRVNFNGNAIFMLFPDAQTAEEQTEAEKELVRIIRVAITNGPKGADGEILGCTGR